MKQRLTTGYTFWSTFFATTLGASVGAQPTPDPHQLHAQYLTQAQVYHDQDMLKDPSIVRLKDIAAGPPGALSSETEFVCTFKPGLSGGSTPKFQCEDAQGTSYKIKYRGDKTGRAYKLGLNYFRKSDGKVGETFAGPVATRLLWALGFPTRHAYQVKNVRCLRCPENPWSFTRSGIIPTPSDVREFVDFPRAMVEVSFGKNLEAVVDQGWSFDADLSKSVTATRDQVDALRLLMAFMQHGDNKTVNQKLLCEKGQGGFENCKAPFFVATDIGSTFGKGGDSGVVTKVNFREWSGRRIWKNPSLCVAQLETLGTGTLEDPRISERGRVFLLERIQQLSPIQIEALFKQGRIHEWDPDHNPSNGDVSHWVKAFQQKVAQIAAVKCPTP